MKEGIIKDAYELIIKEIQTIISIAYIVAVGIGMLFNYQKYILFGINIFDYADVFDFLISPFSDVKIISFTIVSIILASVIVYADIMWKKKFPNIYSRFNFGADKKTWFTTIRYVSTAALLVLYLVIAAEYYGKVTKEEILNQSTVRIRFSDDEIKKGKMIGKTNDVIFLLNGANVVAIPITSLVKEIEIAN